MDKLNWKRKDFTDISRDELYEILRLRAEVFVVEQNCFYLDPDGYDQAGLHLLGEANGELLAYARLLPPGLQYPEDCSITRVVTAGRIRGTGLGKELMELSIRYCRETWPGQGITISAQRHVEGFYQALRFETISETYLDAGIPHVRMRLAWNEDS